MSKIKAWLLPAPSHSPQMKRAAWPVLVALTYVMLNYVLGGLQEKHVIMASLCALYYYNEKTLLFLKYFFPFMLTGIVYDSMRYYYWWGVEGHIHVAEPYEIEKKLFGVMSDGKLVTLNEFFEVHTYKILDFFCGFAYLFFVLQYLSAAFFLFFTKRFKLLRSFGWCFFLVNVMGFATYYIYPAAPPWYITQYGLGPAQMYIHATASAASRFDLIFGTHFFDAMYSQSVDVYGAIPSLHVAYPFLVSWVCLTVKKFRPPAIAFYFLMCFSAVYLQHHYVIDIILGTLYSMAALLTVRYFEERNALGEKGILAKLSSLLCPASTD